MAKKKTATLTDLARIATPKRKSSARKDHPEMPLDEATRQKVADWIPIRLVWNLLKSKEEVLRRDMEGDLFEKYVDALWAQKSRPTNPSISILDDAGVLESTFIVKDIFSIPTIEAEGEQEPADVLVALLVNGGVEEERASALVENEIEWIDSYDIPLGSLLTGFRVGREVEQSSDVQQSAASKLVTAIQKAQAGKKAVLDLTAEEAAVLIIKESHKPQVKKGFLERVASYCESRNELGMVLAIIRPQIANNAKFGNTTDSDKRKRHLALSTLDVLDLEPKISGAPLFEQCLDILDRHANVEGQKVPAFVGRALAECFDR